MKRIIITLLFLTSLKLLSQTERITEFYPLTPIDTLNLLNEEDKYERIDNLNNENFFFSYKDKKHKSGLLLIKRNNVKWIVYDFENDIFNSSNTVIKSFNLENENFISFQISKFPSGSNSNIFGFFVLVNIDTCKIIKYCNYNSQESYDEYGQLLSQSKCKTETIFDNGILKLISSDNSDDLSCQKSAVYKIENDLLIKTMYYLSTHKEFYPTICNEEYDICTGMNFNSLKEKFSNVTFKDAPLYEYGYDSDKLGVEVYSNGKLQIYTIVNDDNIVVGISYISSKFKFEEISTDNSVSEILNDYLTSKLYIDLVTDFEYIYLKEQKIRLVFKTNNSNRIGIYENDFEDGTRKIIRPNAKIDFINK